MLNLSKMRKQKTIHQAVLLGSFLAIVFVAGCAATWQAPPSWTLRRDGHIRASQRNEDFTLQQFMDKIDLEEGKKIAYVVTPAGEAAIERELVRRDAEITELKNQLSECK